MRQNSEDIARAAISIATSSSRSKEEKLIKELNIKGYKGAAVNIGGNLIDSIPKVIERAIIASRRTGIIRESLVEDGAVAGAAREAIMQVVSKAMGLNVGGKIGIARYKEHINICIFMSIGLLHLNEIVIGLGHRSLPELDIE